MRKIGLYKKRKMSAKRIEEKNKVLALLSRVNNCFINAIKDIRANEIPTFFEGIII